MPRIQVPQRDNFPTQFDKVIGSDADRGFRTKNYLLGDIFSLFNSLGAAGVFSYTFTANLNSLDTSDKLMATNDSETDSNGINLFRFSRVDLYEKDLSVLVDNYNNNRNDVVLKVTSEEDPNYISAYTITGINITTNYVDVSVLRHRNFNNLTFELGKNFVLSFDLVNLLVTGTGSITNTSQLVNDGADGINPFISEADIITDHTGLTSIGVNTHAQIDSHIADTSVHFTIAEISITESQISDLGTYLTSGDIDTFAELNAIVTDEFLAVRGDNLSEFINDLGYITGFTETDPIFIASDAFGITATDISNWNAAFGWGDHTALYDDYGGWNLQTNTVFRESITSGAVLNLIAGTNIGLEYTGSGGVRISNTEVGGGQVNTVQPGTDIAVDATDPENPIVSFTGSITETDPVFVASDAFGITALDISNWDTAFGWGDHSLEGYLTSFTETDPVFIASDAFGITALDISNWDTSFGWGDHALAGYLTSFTETDPVFIASDAFGITAADISNWDTSFSWGDHALEGYLTSVIEDDIIGNAIYRDQTDIVSGNITLSLSTFVSCRINLNGANATIVDTTDRPTLGQSFTRYYELSTTNGTESYTLPVDWIQIGEIDATVTNYLSVEYSNYETVGMSIKAFINQETV